MMSSGYDLHETEHEPDSPANSDEDSENDDNLEGSGFGETDSEGESDFDDSSEEFGSGDGSEEDDEGGFEYWLGTQGLVDDYEN
jgi:hypothetical protein